MRAGYLSRRDSAKLLERIEKLNWASGIAGKKMKNVLQIVGEDFRVYVIGDYVLAEIREIIFPTLHEEHNRELLERLPALVVDMGAIPHIARGADIMRPGVRGFRGSFGEGDLLIIRDERNLRPIAVSRALKSIEECRVMEKGKIAENIHHVDDRIWRLVLDSKHLLRPD
jgi:predicted RNA-binding protein (TIGR00451 family)